jgi:hypothetical protein
MIYKFKIHYGSALKEKCNMDSKKVNIYFNFFSNKKYKLGKNKENLNKILEKILPDEKNLNKIEILEKIYPEKNLKDKPWDIKKLKILQIKYDAIIKGHETFKELTDEEIDELNNEDSNLYDEISDIIDDFCYNPSKIIENLKIFFNNKIKKLDNYSSKFTNKIINNENDIEIEKYLLKEKEKDFYDESIYYFHWYDYFKKSLDNNFMYLNFNLIKFINDILTEEIDYGNKTNNINNKIHKDNYYITYELIIKLINIKSFKNLNLISLFFSDDEINCIIKFIFEEKIHKDNLSNDDNRKFVNEFFKIYNDLRFKIDDKNFKYLIELTKKLKFNIYKQNDNFNINLSNENYRLMDYKKLLHIYYNNKDNLNKEDIMFIKNDVYNSFKYQEQTDDYIIVFKNFTGNLNTDYKYNLYHMFSILYVLDLFDNEEIEFIEKIISVQIKILNDEKNEYHNESSDEKKIKDYLEKEAEEAKKKEEEEDDKIFFFEPQYYDNRLITPYDFLVYKEGEKKKLIELDGRYHYRLSIEEDGSLINKYQIKDLIKTELAINLDYKLYRLTFLPNVEEIEIKKFNDLYFINNTGNVVRNFLSNKTIKIYLNGKEDNIFDEENNIINTDLDFKKLKIKDQYKIKKFKIKKLINQLFPKKKD